MLSLTEDEALARLGPVVPFTDAAPHPSRVTIPGRYIDLVPLEPHHADALFPLVAQPEHERLWDYMLDTPFNGDKDRFSSFIADRCGYENNMVFWAIQDRAPPTPDSPKILGYLSYLRIDSTHRSIGLEISCSLRSSSARANLPKRCFF